jgi:ERCC4-type nuclease
MTKSKSSFAHFDDDPFGTDLTAEAPDIETYDKSAHKNKWKVSPFTIIYDSREQDPYTFKNIMGDHRDNFTPIRVKTVRKKVEAGDYAILNLPGIAIERKSKADLFGSLANNEKRENFITRLRRMQETLKFGAVVIECLREEIYIDPPVHTSLSPKSVDRTTLSWAMQFPLIHWYWCQDRKSAEELAYRLLEKFYEHETSLSYVHHNRPIDENLEAFKLGISKRLEQDEFEPAYCKGNPLQLSWCAGWAWASHELKGGDLGTMNTAQSLQGLTKPSLRDGRSIQGKGNPPAKSNPDKVVPLPGQTSFLDEDNGLADLLDPTPEDYKKLRQQIGDEFDRSCRENPVSKRKRKQNGNY